MCSFDPRMSQKALSIQLLFSIWLAANCEVMYGPADPLDGVSETLKTYLRGTSGDAVLDGKWIDGGQHQFPVSHTPIAEYGQASVVTDAPYCASVGRYYQYYLHILLRLILCVFVSAVQSLQF